MCLTRRAHMSAPLLPQPRPLPFLCQVGPTRQAVASPTQRVPLCSPGPACRIHPFPSFSRASARAHRRESRHACALHGTDAQIPSPTLTRTPRPLYAISTPQPPLNPRAPSSPLLRTAPPRKVLCAATDQPHRALPAHANHRNSSAVRPGFSPGPSSPTSACAAPELPRRTAAGELWPRRNSSPPVPYRPC